MNNSQEIIERSIWASINDTAVAWGYAVDPEEYLPPSDKNKERLAKDLKNLSKYIRVFGPGNPQSRGKKETPRIAINPRGFYPGTVGLPKSYLDQVDSEDLSQGYTYYEEPYQSIDQFVDIHLVADNQMDMRLLHTLLFHSIPQRGYLKPYTLLTLPPTGNIFIELVNYNDIHNVDQGLIEKVYQFSVLDSLVTPAAPSSDDIIPPITDIHALLEEYDIDIKILTQ